MKNLLISSCAAALAAAVFLLAPLPPARGQEMDHATVEDLITAGPWKITYQQPYVGNWTITRFFDKDGTFSTPGRPDISGRWKVYNKMVVQTFADGRKDAFLFPIAAAGVTGVAKTGIKLTAVRDNSAARPAPAPIGGALEDPREREAAETLLTSGPWKMSSAGNWSAIHIFNKDGSFTTPGSASESGHWKIAGGMVTLTYAAASTYYSPGSYANKDYIFLPLNAKSTPGARDSGMPATIALVNTPPAAASNPPGTNPLSTPPPRPIPGSASMRQEDRVAAEELLVSGPWKISGSGWSAVRIFDKDGTFSTLGQAGNSGHGHWKIANNLVYLVYADTHTDTLLLPLNEKSTAGTDQYGQATTAALVNGSTVAAGGTRTPAPIVPTPAARPTRTPALADGTPALAPAPASAGGGNPTVALLTSGSWKFSTDKWTATRIFKKDGTFTTKNKSADNGTWTVTDDKALIILAFPNGHKDALTLPLDPNGTSGIADSSDTMTAVQVLPAPVAARTPKPGGSPAVLNPYGVSHD